MSIFLNSLMKDICDGFSESKYEHLWIILESMKKMLFVIDLLKVIRGLNLWNLRICCCETNKLKEFRFCWRILQDLSSKLFQHNIFILFFRSDLIWWILNCMRWNSYPTEKLLTILFSFSNDSNLFITIKTV